MRTYVAGIIAERLFALLRAATAAAVLVGLILAPPVHSDQYDPRLPALFKALKATDDPDEGDRIGRRIASIWGEHRNEGVIRIMAQGQRFVDQGHLELALGNFTTVTRMAPEFAEAWNKRASVFYKMGELEAAAKSVAETLAREPRHFLAIAGLGVIYMQMGDAENALQAFDYALSINPHLVGTRSAADRIRQRLGE